MVFRGSGESRRRLARTVHRAGGDRARAPCQHSPSAGIFMVDQGDIAEAIEDHPAEAAEALEALQPGAAAPKTMASLAVNAESLSVELPGFAANFIVQRGWAEEFVQA